MDFNRFLTQRNLIIGSIVALLGLVSVIVWQSVTLRIVSTSPDVNNVSNAEPFIDIVLNSPLEKVEDVKINDTASEHEIVDKNTVRINLANLQDNTENSLVIGSITAKNGKRLNNIQLVLRSHYVDFNQQSEESQQESIRQSNSGQSTDPFFIKNSFPLAGDDFVIRDQTVEYEYPILDVTFNEEIASSPEARRPQVSDARALELQQKVIAFIKEKGGTPEKYHIAYSNDYLNSLNPNIGD